MSAGFGESDPRWSPSGDTLYFMSGDRRVIAVPARVENGRRVLGAPKPMFATLQQGTTAAFVVSIDSSRGQMYIVPAAYSRDVQRVAELWLLMPNERPKSLGLLDPAQPMTMTVPDAMRGRMKEGMGLAVSLEPPGGSPTGQPTGPVVAQGKFVGL